MSDDLKDILCTVLRVLEKIAEKTTNPIDDIVVKALRIFLNCPK